MPREKAGREWVSIEFPDDVLAALRARAEASGESVTAVIVRAAAKAVGVRYSPPRRGRPRKDAAPAPGR